MKNYNLFIYSFILLLTVSCRKDSNSLSGRITFNHPTTQEEFGATLGVVSLHKKSIEETNGIATYSTKVDEYGVYYFPRIIKGDYELQIKYQFESYFYDTIIPMTFKLKEKQKLDVLLKP